ncbi:hypothetical protein DE146DRAFT_611102 [Phaeosphaeria sp. MPI-PUGE-AT-0046c]|nr:hypothetical protein DE146DRAFT_611102 [Phaeosphaeria sp. MPI-PUGE-AT-0046c]
MTESNPLIFYDISSPLEPRSYAPNPSKGRLTLSFKNLPFKTKWVDILDIPDVRKGLNCPATRKLDDGSDYYTLPMMHDLSSGKVLGDTFDIANYLHDHYPDSGGCLFPSDSKGTGLDYQSPHKDTPFYAPLTTNEGSKHSAYAKFNVHVDTTFTCYVGLVSYNLPFNPEKAEETRTLFIKRAHLKSWDDLAVEGEAREQLMAAFNKALTSLAELYMVNKSGPYLEGEVPNYADLIVGGWLNMFYMTMRKEEWEQVRTWHGGVFARLHDVLQEKYYKY